VIYKRILALRHYAAAITDRRHLGLAPISNAHPSIYMVAIKSPTRKFHRLHQNLRQNFTTTVPIDKCEHQLLR
jgi:hypothetical protein